jgi:hypothetical protein
MAPASHALPDDNVASLAPQCVKTTTPRAPDGARGVVLLDQQARPQATLSRAAPEA